MSDLSSTFEGEGQLTPWSGLPKPRGLELGLGLGLGLVSGWLVIMHAYFYYFPLSRCSSASDDDVVMSSAGRGRHSVTYEHVRRVVSQPPDRRKVFEVNNILPWFRALCDTKVLGQLKPGITTPPYIVQMKWTESEE